MGRGWPVVFHLPPPFRTASANDTMPVTHERLHSLIIERYGPPGLVPPHPPLAEKESVSGLYGLEPKGTGIKSDRVPSARSRPPRKSRSPQTQGPSPQDGNVQPVLYPQFVSACHETTNNCHYRTYDAGRSGAEAASKAKRIRSWRACCALQGLGWRIQSPQ